MSLILSLLFTVIAVVTACVAIPYFLFRRWRLEERLKQTARDIEHIEHKWCKCYWCNIERLQNDEDI